MMSPTKRFIAVVYTLFGVFIAAVAYFGMSRQVEFTGMVLVLTGSIFIVVHGLFKRSLPAILVGAGLFVESYPSGIRFALYAGAVLVFGGFGLLLWQHRKTTPRPTISA